MKTRILTALVLIPVVAYLAGWAPWWLFFLVLLAVAEGSLREYFAICRHAGHTPCDWLGYAGVLFACGAQELGTRRTEFALRSERYLVEFMVLLLLAAMTVQLFRSVDLAHYLTATASLVFGVTYVGLTLSLLVPLRSAGAAVSGRSSGLLFFLFLVVWIGDACACFGGRALGRTPLFPRVSPHKTVEGSVVGFVGSVLAGWIFAHWLWRPQPSFKILVVAAVVAIAGQVGDLAESALKRSANLKDSGSILPGHGGFLDRVDSLLFGAPVLWIALRWWFV